MTDTVSAPKSTRSRLYLRIENLTKKFGNFTALNGVSLDVYEGEFICFLGPSGCGKTTLLRTIAGLEIRTSGRIEQAGRDISSLPPAQRDFGIVFQSYALFPNLTVIENVAYGLDRRKMGNAVVAARVDELLQLVGMPEQGSKYPAQLSGGQQQRVALARALAISPGLLLLDEPLSALDAKVRARLRHEIKLLQHRLGVTTILVTHDQEEALTMADRIVVLNDGVIHQVGTPTEIYRHPADQFVASFVGAMNYLPAVAVGDGRVRCVGVEITPGICPDDLAKGAAVTACVRPEDILARDVDATTANALEVKVVDIEFLGFFFRAELTPTGTDDASFYANFSTNLVYDADVRVGRSMTVAFREERVQVFKNP